MTKINKVKNTSSNNNEVVEKTDNSQAKIALIILIITLISSLLLATFSNTLENWGDEGGSNVFIRVLIGLSLGYILVRSYFGFAGSVNRAMRGNSFKLMRAIMFMFGLTSIFIGFIYMFNMTSITKSINPWWNNPISPGLAIGAILFGFGMAFSSACASGGLTDGSWNPMKMIIVVMAFGLGVLLAFPMQYDKGHIIGDESNWHNFLYGGVVFNFNQDIVKNKPMIGAIIGVSITIILCLTVVSITKVMDIILLKKNKTISSFSEEDFSKEWTRKELKETYKTTYSKLIERPLTLIEGAISLSIVFVIMVLLTHDAWGVSTPYGLWVGHILTTFNIVSVKQLNQYVGLPLFSLSFTQNVNGLQNIGIFIGGIIAALSMNKYNPIFKVSVKEAMLWTFGGILMGVGTRLSNGCNVGSLYSPIAFGSASGWVFLIFMVIGSVIGNIIFKKIK